MSTGRLARLVGRIAAVAGVVLAVLAIRVVTASRAELSEGDRLRGAGELDAAIPHYRRAAGWYAPGNPYCTDALAQLAAIGTAAEAAGDSRRALSAWRAVRAGIMSSRSVFTPHGDRLEEADAHIVEAMASEEVSPIDAGRRRAELERELRRQLRDNPRPQPLWSVLLLCGFVGWVGAAFAFVTRAIDGEDRIVPGPARRWGTVFVAGFGLFLLGLLLA